MKNWTSSGRDRCGSRDSGRASRGEGAGSPHLFPGFLVPSGGWPGCWPRLPGRRCPSVHPERPSPFPVTGRNGAWAAPPRFKPPGVRFLEPLILGFPKSKVKRQTQSNSLPTNLGDFCFSLQFATVYKARDKNTNQIVAIKKVSCSLFSWSLLEGAGRCEVVAGHFTNLGLDLLMRSALSHFQGRQNLLVSCVPR